MTTLLTQLLTQPGDLTASHTFVGLIYGQPGVGKSTLALSAPNPICIDFDHGMKRVQPQHRAPSLQVATYAQVLELLNGKEIEPFDTIIMDTLGKTIDRICDYCASNNPKARQGDGTMTRKGWGEVKNTFHALLKLLKSKGKSLLFVAHESEEKNGDDTIKRPDCSGSARKDIVKELDFMGYMEMVGTKRTINFAPTDKYYAKNSLGLKHAIEIPDTEKGNSFIAKEIVKLSEERLKEQSALRVAYDALIKGIDAAIGATTNAEQVNAYYVEMGKREPIWDSHFYERRKLAEHIAKIGVEFDKEKKVFIVAPAKAEAANAPANPISGQPVIISGNLTPSTASTTPPTEAPKKGMFKPKPEAEGL